MSRNFKMNLSFKELRGLLFRPKKCSICGCSLEKVKHKKDLGVQKIYIGMTTYKGQTTEIKLEYYCKNCGKTFNLDEL